MRWSALALLEQRSRKPTSAQNRGEATRPARRIAGFAEANRCGSALVLARPRHQGEDERCTACDHDGGNLSKVFHATECRANSTSVHQGRLRRSAELRSG